MMEKSAIRRFMASDYESALARAASGWIIGVGSWSFAAGVFALFGVFPMPIGLAAYMALWLGFCVACMCGLLPRPYVRKETRIRKETRK